MLRLCSLGCLACCDCRQQSGSEGDERVERVELESMQRPPPSESPPAPFLPLKTPAPPRQPSPPNLPQTSSNFPQVRRPRYEFHAPREWGSYEADGRQLRLWIANAQNQPPCPINPSTLTFAHLVNHFGPNMEEKEGVDVDDPTGYLSELGYSNSLTPSHSANTRWIHFNSGKFAWSGYIAPGMITLTIINRGDSANNPPISQVSQAVYQRDWNIDTLRHVFVWDIVNLDTISFFQTHMYGVRIDLQWPNINRLIWRHGTAEYDAI